jgi:hypothetical protein
MTEQEKLDWQEYETRELVFKVNDNTDYNCHFLVKHDLRMFKGTRKEFDKYYLINVGNLPTTDYMVYDEQSKIDKVEHGACDNNIIYIRNNRAGVRRQAEYKYLKSSF